MFFTPQSTRGTLPGIRPLQGVAGLAGVCHGVPVCRVVVCHVTMGWGCRVSAVDRDAGGGRRLPHPNLCAGGVMRPKEVVTLGTLVVGDLTVARALKLCLPVGHMLGGLRTRRSILDSDCNTLTAL